MAPSDAVSGTFRFVRSVLTEAPWQATLVVGLTFALILTSSVSLVMLVPLLGVAGLDVGGGSIGYLADLAVGALAAIGLQPSIPTVIGAYLAIVLVNAVLSHVQAVRTVLLYQAFAMALRLRVYEAITRCRWSSFVRRPSSGFVHTLTQEVERVGAAVYALLNLFVKLVMTVVYLVLALVVSPWTTLLVVGCGGALMALMARRTRLGRAKGEAVSKAYAALYEAISEHLAGMRVTKSHGAEALHLERFRERTAQTAGSQIDMVRNQADVGFGLQTGSAVIMAGVFLAALVAFELPLASILFLLYLFARLVPEFTGLQRQVQRLLNKLPAVERVEATLNWLTENAEPSGPDTEAPTLTRVLRLERVGFGYLGTEGDSVLHAVDLEVPAGRTTAIVGPSGGGKSTVADLVVGLLTPDEGRVLVDGLPLEAGRLRAWRERIGYVSQDNFLFHDTIRANLAFVRPGATDAELRDALRSASAAFVENLPEGLDTVVGDRGVRLSGGERQRIALARAILRQPAMLVLDEATSALDPENERVIQDAIGRMAGRQTILLIAHRLASVRGADVIHVMEGGRIVESGTWDDLARRPQGRFRDLCVAQGLLGTTAAAYAPALP